MAATIRRRNRVNAETLNAAHKHRQQWTGAELDIALRDDLTAREKARRLGRTYMAIKAARYRATTDPKWQAVVRGGYT